MLERLARGPWGRVLRAIREDEHGHSRSARTRRNSGCRPRHRRRYHGTSGRGGAFHRLHRAGQINVPMLTFQVWAMLIVGGSGNNKGAILRRELVCGIWGSLGRRRLRPLSAGTAGAGGGTPDRHDRRRALAPSCRCVHAVSSVRSASCPGMSASAPCQPMERSSDGQKLLTARRLPETCRSAASSGWPVAGR